VPIEADHLGRLTVTSHPATAGLSGRIFRRRKPQADDPAGEYVVALGATDVGGSAGPMVELVVASATWGATPSGWEAPSVTYDLDAFAQDYAEATPAERAALALEQAAEAKAVSTGKRQSPWSRS